MQESKAMTTFSAKSHEVRRNWYLVDASGKVLGRLAAEIARRLRGKHKPEFTPHVDTGDYVVVVNAGKLRVRGTRARPRPIIATAPTPAGSMRLRLPRCRRGSRLGRWRSRSKGCYPKGRLATQCSRS